MFVQNMDSLAVAMVATIEVFRCVRISIRGLVRRLVGWSVGWSVTLSSKLIKDRLLRILNDLHSAE